MALFLVLVLAVADTLELMRRGEPLSLRVPVRTCVAGYSSCVAQHILVHRKHGILSALRRVRHAARAIEPEASNASKVGRGCDEQPHQGLVVPLSVSVLECKACSRFCSKLWPS